MTLPQFLSAAFLRWMGLAATAAVLGGLVLGLLVLPRGTPDLVPVRRRLRWWNLTGVAALMVTTAGELVVRAETMSGGPLAAALAAVPLVLARTHFGTIWIARTALLLLVLALMILPPPGPQGIALFLAIGIALTTSLTGHAADWGDVSLTVFVDWAHVLASAAWTGGLGALAVIALTQRAAWPPALLGAVARRFSRLAGLCLVVVLGSGAYNAWLQVRAWSPLWTTAYGRVLLVKLLAVLGLAGLGAINRYAVVPRLDPTARAAGMGARLFRRMRLAFLGLPRRKDRPVPSRLAANVACEAVIAVAVFACTAVLGESAPARHAIHAAHRASGDTERGPVHITMQALHATGGVPKGWIFSSPPGDIARGRRVFARLECYRCHAVQGEGFSAPSAPGPELTGMGAHHPEGYLAESIMNPNAVIVDGPGYTGPDGMSTMPDYRDSLTVGELIDLIAYLGSR